MRVVLDTNILISALITRDTPPGRIFDAWLDGAFEVVTSRAHMAEVAEVLARPRLQRYIDPDEATAVVENLDTRTLMMESPPSVDWSPDPDDNVILAAAIAGSADFVVSGDKRHLLALDEVTGIAIVTARDFLTRF